jgi:hypothetical protein
MERIKEILRKCMRCGQKEKTKEESEKINYDAVRNNDLDFSFGPDNNTNNIEDKKSLQL